MHGRFRRLVRQLAKRVIKAKLAVIVVVLTGKTAVHFGLIQGRPAEAVEFGSDVLHLVFSGIATLVG